MGGVIKLSSKENKWNLYVLRYKRFGHYYVGTAENFKERMLDHWKEISDAPQWSILNKSKQGFIFYWFIIEEDGVSRSDADLCENHLAKLIARKIKCINGKNFIKEVHVGNNNFIDGKPENNKEKYINNNKNVMELNDIDKEIYNYLKKLRTLKSSKMKKRLSIKCFEVGCVGKYQEQDNWDDAVALIKFSCERKEI